ncbi:sigma-70 family RNA polymerase sigma factor [Streptomyces bottropensis]|uniref:Sigma factor n=1 Tax=Streptomyces bottropensis ATCC 25435 TaxID=1054862 RepID=M3EPS9_9ACTN|nr:sigma-70 family RNA polymerase sigma factor [Streptomyces bottropensis]EMF51038.1 sigma factor [Streptomyces bottropensis ATCC 25435]MZD21350.1 sigma-70 family RNA polymerase sigma factor [Streptomyces sp. SID5476]
MTHAQRFRDIYEECYPRVLAYATSLVGRQVGEDITSETFTVAWRRVRDIPRPALPWLLGVARNLVRELRRRDAHQYALAAAEAQHISSGARPGVGDVAADVTEREAALQALASLSDADRELLTLIAWHGLSARQAARVLGCTTATLTVRLHRARRRLEKALEPAHLADTTPVRDTPPAPARNADSAPRAPRASPMPQAPQATHTPHTPHTPHAPRRTDRRGALT